MKARFLLFLLVLFATTAACVGAGPQISIVRDTGAPSGEPSGEPDGGSAEGEPAGTPASGTSEEPKAFQALGSGVSFYQSENHRGFGMNASLSGGVARSEKFQMMSPQILMGRQRGEQP